MDNSTRLERCYIICHCEEKAFGKWTFLRCFGDVFILTYSKELSDMLEMMEEVIVEINSCVQQNYYKG